MTGIRKSHKRRGPIAEINMIPLIDVSLVLLIIFMVMTPFLVQQQIRVNLPRSVAASEPPDRPIVISIQREGEMSVNGHAVSAAMLESELQSALAANHDRPVMIQADRDLALQKVVMVMDVAKRLSVGKLGISVEQPK
jgi:biopolymer transport protein ExbD